MVLQKIKEALSLQFAINEDSISDTTDVISDIGADSLDIVELLMTLEEEYGLLITDDMIKDVRTVGELSDLIESLLD